MNSEIKADFTGLKTQVDGQTITYLDSAATSLKPRQVVKAITDYYEGVCCNVHRGKHMSIEKVSVEYEMGRAKVAEFIGAAANEIVFVRSTTEALNLVAQGLALSEQDRVLVCTDAHHANLLPWMSRADVSVVGLNAMGELDLDDYARQLKSKPKVVAINHCSNVTGVYLDIQRMLDMASEAGAITVVDAAQSVPHQKINVAQWQADFVAFSGHKMLGPTGIGVLFGKASRLESLSPSQLGGGMVDWVDLQGFQLRKIPHRFEAGTPHIAGTLGLAAAIDYLQKTGMSKITEHDRKLGKLMYELAQERAYLAPVNQNPAADRGGIISLKVKGLDNLDELSRVLSDSYGIMCRHGHLCAQPYIDDQAGGHVIRVSGYLYTEEQDVRRFFEALDELAGFMIPQTPAADLSADEVLI